MKPLVAIHLAGIAILGTAAGFAGPIGSDSPFAGLLSIDWTGTPCIPEDRLDEAFMTGKGATVPPTCIPDDWPLTPETIEWALGHQLHDDERGGYVWRSALAHGESVFIPIDDPVTAAPTRTPLAAVPVPAMGIGLGAAFGLLIFVARKFR